MQDEFDKIAAESVDAAGDTSNVEAEYISKDDRPEGPAPDNNAAIDIATADILGAMYSSIFPTMFPKWGVTQEEILLMSQAQGAALDVWFPDGLSWLNGELINKILLTAGAVAITSNVIGPRLKKPRKEVEGDSVEQAAPDADPEYSM